MRSYDWLIVIGVLLSAVADDGLAAPVLIDSSTNISHFIDNQNGAQDDDEYTMILERLRLRSSVSGLTAGARIDSAWFGGKVGARRSEVRLERSFFIFDKDTIRITVGDFYKQLGRGLVLSLRKVDEVGFDIVLRGGEMRAEWGRLDAHLFGGRTNSVNVDNLKYKFVDDPNDILTGGEVKGQIGHIRLGMHGLFRQNQTGLTTSEYSDSSVSIGNFSSGTLFDDSLSFYIETAFQDTRLADKVSRGRAVYGVLDSMLGELITTIEVLQLKDFVQNGSQRNITGQAGDFFRYNQPPTLERIDQETSKGIDEQGIRLMLEYAMLDGQLLLSSNGLLKKEFPGSPGELTTLHAYGGFEFIYGQHGSRLNASGGYRDLSRTGAASTGAFKTMTHTEMTFLQHIAGRTSLRLASIMEFRTLEAQKYVRGSNFIGFENGAWGSVTFEYGIDTLRDEADIRNHFYAGILSANLTESLTLKSTVGTQRGGLKCVAGICRDYPSFAGANMEMLFTQRF